MAYWRPLNTLVGLTGGFTSIWQGVDFNALNNPEMFADDEL
jgi:hypothetical protein